MEPLTIRLLHGSNGDNPKHTHLANMVEYSMDRVLLEHVYRHELLDRNLPHPLLHLLLYLDYCRSNVK